MKNVFSSRMLFAVGSSLLLACSCSGGKNDQSKAPKKEVGPQQDPFEHPDAMDSEGEEGARSDLIQSPREESVVLEKSEEKQPEAIFVTPVVVEAVKIEASQPATLLKEASSAPAVEMVPSS